MAIKPVKVGVVGCGAISNAYLTTAKKYPILEITALADLDMAKAQAAAEKHGVGTPCTTQELMRRDDVEVVLNLTIPKAHMDVALAALENGKHVYNEKPLGVTRDEGQRILQAARKANLRVGCAPDTVLGSGHQTARKLLDEGAIGQPLVVTAFMACGGHETWHPAPEFYYKAGGGPMLDMGPYYLSDLTMLLGPIRKVTGITKVMINPRTITSKPLYGTRIDVETPDHIAGSMEFENGAIGTIITSFAVQGHHLPCIEIHGTSGSLSVPDPNGFGGKVQILRQRGGQWEEVPYSHPHSDAQQRSMGLADMATAIRSGRAHRVTGEQAYHVLDVMLGFEDSSQSGKHYKVPSTFTRPAALQAGLEPGQLDE